ncbi:TRAP transporter substrate-binding protein [Planococcus sp. X10-3]|uniref:TRAP transporter substrate-binding protein n=1 Tax=Planococcus sp. X10-3 TaxID=3061240 RepID=UPI003BB03894
MSNRNLFIVTSLLFLVVLMTACGSTGSSDSNAQDANEESVKLKLNTYEADSMWETTAVAFKEEVEKLSNGEVEIEIHLNSPFGGEREVTEMMQMGTIEMAVMTHGPMGIWVPEFQAFDLPFLFDSTEHAYAVLDSEIVDVFEQKFEEEAGVKIIGWVSNEFVQTANNRKELNTVEDAAGLKLRVQENEVQIDTWEAFGANPIPMAWPEVYTALEQGVIDGTSNNYKSILDNHMHEVTDYVSALDERFGPVGIQISKKIFDSLSSDQQEAILQAAKVAEKAGRDYNAEVLPEAAKKLEEEGMIVTTPDKESFKEKTKSVYEKWTPIFGEDLIESIQELEY